MNQEYVKIVNDTVVASAVCEHAPDANWVLMPGWGDIARTRPLDTDCEYRVSTSSWVVKPKSQDQTAQTVKAIRNQLLADSDWTQLPNGPLSDAQRTAWATYRQALRDVSSQPGYPLHVNWPAQPQKGINGSGETC